METAELSNNPGVEKSAIVPPRNTTPGTDPRPFPDVILKSQFFDVMGKRPLTSEQRLMLAVLADAINVVQDGYIAPNTRKRGSFLEAKNWIFQSGVRCALSFENVCDALAIDADALRWRIGSLLAHTAEGRPAPFRLRLKEAARVQRVTVNRVRRRNRRSRGRAIPH